MINILVVEDDARLNQAVCTFLNNRGYTAKGCLNARNAYDTMYNAMFELIISDIMMPDIDGYEFAESVRNISKTIPILFMTARDDITSKQKGFHAGVDDYMVKPIDMDEPILRIEALLRRANIMESKALTVKNLTLDVDAMTAIVDDGEIALTVREFDVLFKLLSYPKKTFSCASLWMSFGAWTATPAFARWMSISQSSGINFPGVTGSKS